MANPASGNHLNIQTSILSSKSNPLSIKGRDIKLTIEDGNIVQFNSSDFSEMYRKCMPFFQEEIMDSKYIGKPQWYCWDKYKTTDIYDFIMYINGVASPRDFVSKRVKFLSQKGLDLYIYIRKNKTRITKEAVVSTKFREID